MAFRDVLHQSDDRRGTARLMLDLARAADPAPMALRRHEVELQLEGLARLDRVPRRPGERAAVGFPERSRGARHGGTPAATGMSWMAKTPSDQAVRFLAMSYRHEPISAMRSARLSWRRSRSERSASMPGVLGEEDGAPGERARFDQGLRDAREIEEDGKDVRHVPARPVVQHAQGPIAATVPSTSLARIGTPA